ncbi:MAG: LysR family transcriptional regulator [Brevundimonas sp.]|nr:LysR family transcriptional regulator [Brevundimonas sp.]
MPDRRPDLRLLSSLEALLDTRSVSRAAERMGVSQPAMSRILARLRDQLDDPLLVRGRGGMVLTPRAEGLADPLRRWLSSGEDLLLAREFEPARLERAFRIASTDYGILSVIAPGLPVITRSAPGLSLELEALTSASLKRLSEGRLDVVVIGYPPEQAGVRWRRLFTETRTGLCRPDHPILSAPLTADRFFDWPHVAALVGDGFDEPLASDGVDIARRRLLVSAPSFSSIPLLVSGADALAVLPTRAARHFANLYGLATFTPPLPLPAFDYYLAWHERSDTDPATRWLVEALTGAEDDGAALAA